MSVALPGVSHEQVSVNGVRLHVARAGRRGADRSPVVLLHGFPGCWHSWRFQLAGLADRFHLIAPDLRGYGTSDKPAGGYDLPTLAEDTAELIRKNGGRAHLVGHDWGGVIAWETAMRHPERVDRLAILAAPHPAWTAVPMLTSLDQLRRSLYILYFQLQFGIPERKIAEDGFRRLRRAIVGTAHHRRNFSDADFDVLVSALAEPGALQAALAYYRTAFRRVLIPPLARSIHSPTLVLWADDDRALGPRLLDGITRLVPHAAVEVVPDCSHFIQEDRPDLVNERLTHFLEPC